MTTWTVIRAAGVGAYLALFLTVSWGLIATTSLLSTRIAKSTSVLIHQVLGSVGLALLAVHLGGLLADRFVRFDVPDLLVPFRVEKLATAVALGVFALYACVLVLLTSWLRKGIGTVWWRRFHLLATPAFVLALMHGMLAGTDSARPWLWWTYLGTALVVVFLLLMRALTDARPSPRARNQAEPRPRSGAAVRP